jgi:hypothetical protein
MVEAGQSAALRWQSSKFSFDWSEPTLAELSSKNRKLSIVLKIAVMFLVLLVGRRTSSWPEDPAAVKFGARSGTDLESGMRFTVRHT